MLNQNYDLPDIEIASKYFLKKLEKEGYKVFSVLSRNKLRHKLIYCNGGHWFYLMFKREKFINWLNYFSQLEELKDEIKYVDSINISLLYNILDLSKNKNFSMVIIYSDKTILTKTPKEWLDTANEFSLYRKVRKLNIERAADYSGDDKFIEERTMSCYFTEGDIWK